MLNTHGSLLVGQERYFKKIRGNSIAPQHFEKSRFLDVRDGDTHAHTSGLKLASQDLSKRYDDAMYVGDKFPSLFRHFDRIFELFPDAKHVYIVRNPLSVIESYDARHQDPDDHWQWTCQDGMDAWNESVGKVARLGPTMLEQFFIIQYEEFYRTADSINALFVQMGLGPVAGEKLQHFVRKFETLNEKPVPRRDDLRLFVARNADWDSYRKLCSIMENRQIRG